MSTHARSPREVTSRCAPLPAESCGLRSAWLPVLRITAFRRRSALRIPTSCCLHIFGLTLGHEEPIAHNGLRRGVIEID